LGYCPIAAIIDRNVNGWFLVFSFSHGSRNGRLGIQLNINTRKWNRNDRCSREARDSIHTQDLQFVLHTTFPDAIFWIHSVSHHDFVHTLCPHSFVCIILDIFAEID
jgi:hypothetical protein